MNSYLIIIKLRLCWCIRSFSYESEFEKQRRPRYHFHRYVVPNRRPMVEVCGNRWPYKSELYRANTKEMPAHDSTVIRARQRLAISAGGSLWKSRFWRARNREFDEFRRWMLVPNIQTRFSYPTLSRLQPKGRWRCVFTEQIRWRVWHERNSRREVNEGGNAKKANLSNPLTIKDTRCFTGFGVRARVVCIRNQSRVVVGVREHRDGGYR